MPVNARERLLETAERLFYAEGIRAVGVERILEESGVGRASFYRHFASKDDLVVEVLRRRDEAWRAWLAASVAPAAPEERPLAVFDAMRERFERRDFRGCAFGNSIAETADPDHPVHRVAAEHKAKVVAMLDDLLAEAGHADHAELARSLMLLVDGAIVTAVREESPDAAGLARQLAARLLAGSREGSRATAPAH